MNPFDHGSDIAVLENAASALIGGMLAASLIGIFFIPAMFYLVEKWSGTGKQHQAPAAAEGATAEAD